MDILLVASAFNSLSQRVYAELSDRGHRVDIVLALDKDEAVREAVRAFEPELIIAPMLRTAIGDDVWSAHTCLIVHPGPPGDRGPSSLDWAVATGARRWGVTVLQAVAAMDAGPIWASVAFDVPPDAGKSDLYRNELSDAAVAAVLLAVERYEGGCHRPRSQDCASVHVVWRDAFRQERRRIDWERDGTEVVLRKLRGADSRPGVRDEILGVGLFLHGGHPEDELHGRPGDVLATRSGAVCRATRDGAVWIPELRARRRPGAPATFRLPAALVLGDRLKGVPEVNVPLQLDARRRTWSDIRYGEHDGVGFLRFAFPGGAMSSDQCRRLLAAYRFALTRPTRVLMVGGQRDFFSNGIHLNVIEAAADQAAESWANINAMDDLVEAVLRTGDRLVIAALGGNAAAGGVMLALAADEVWCRTGTVLNPHYRRMGLYGSEYWTYSLPRRVGAATARRLMAEAVPVSAVAGADLGLVDRVLPVSAQAFPAEVERAAVDLAAAGDLGRRIAAKRAERARDEGVRPLAEHRRAELARMHDIFFDPTAPYHRLRASFVHKLADGPVRPLAARREHAEAATP